MHNGKSGFAKENGGFEPFGTMLFHQNLRHIRPTHSNRSNASASDLSPSSELYSQPLGTVTVPPPGARMQGQPPPPPPPAQPAAGPHQQGMIQVSVESI